MCNSAQIVSGSATDNSCCLSSIGTGLRRLEQNDITLNRKGIPFAAAIWFKSIRATMEARVLARPISMDLRKRAMERLDRGQTVRQVAAVLDVAPSSVVK